ncbi:hypothetical protein MGYG_09172 [Nannizzia gypsea CBS 118893]|uniref:Uncharacterized protein n=1 Tax=Arthroderma gypseum (strain ATCC MYA-4604 / CBS 118893) TaxID=535722 RepID=E4V4B2_ARTGP|nr:hypothetical protein MGYG_09172 [Nannizzia gypsea CBS 118893]EFR04836.1 hypothetical protein MGYG_09172 [Nannizzia gypsea CBS 118893]
MCSSRQPPVPRQRLGPPLWECRLYVIVLRNGTRYRYRVTLRVGSETAPAELSGIGMFQLPLCGRAGVVGVVGAEGRWDGSAEATTKETSRAASGRFRHVEVLETLFLAVEGLEKFTLRQTEGGKREHTPNMVAINDVDLNLQTNPNEQVHPESSEIPRRDTLIVVLITKTSPLGHD